MDVDGNLNMGSWEVLNGVEVFLWLMDFVMRIYAKNLGWGLIEVKIGIISCTSVKFNCLGYFHEIWVFEISEVIFVLKYQVMKT